MDKIFDLLKNFSNLSNQQENKTENIIPKEVLDQYPYGEFPIRYTKLGQETIRKQSENRFSYNNDEQSKNNNKSNDNNFLQIGTLLPFIQMLAGGKKQPKDMMQLFSKFLFKDNPELQKLFSLIPNIKNQEIKNNSEFPNTNKIQISSLKRID